MKPHNLCYGRPCELINQGRSELRKGAPFLRLGFRPLCRSYGSAHWVSEVDRVVQARAGSPLPGKQEPSPGERQLETGRQATPLGVRVDPDLWVDAQRDSGNGNLIMG